MLSQPTEHLLKSLFVAIGQGERDLENDRKKLGRQRGFSVANAFHRVSMNNHGFVTADEIVEFLFQNQVCHAGVEEAQTLIEYFGGEHCRGLTLDNFSHVFLSCDDVGLRKAALEDRPLVLNKKLPLGIELAMTNVLKNEILLLRRIEKIK